MVNEMYDELALYCEDCYDRIYHSTLAVEDNEGQWYHLKCARKYFIYKCKNCGCSFGEDVFDNQDEDERGCPECEGEIELMTPQQIRKVIKGEKPTMDRQFGG